MFSGLIGHFKNFLASSEKEVRLAVISTCTFLINFVSQTCQKASFATFDQRYCTACKLNMQKFLKVDMVTITAGQTSFVGFENDVKILFSEWPIVCSFFSLRNCAHFNNSSCSFQIFTWLLWLVEQVMFNGNFPC